MDIDQDCIRQDMASTWLPVPANKTWRLFHTIQYISISLPSFVDLLVVDLESSDTFVQCCGSFVRWANMCANYLVLMLISPDGKEPASGIKTERSYLHHGDIALH